MGESMRLLYKAVAAGAVGAAGLTALAAPAEAAAAHRADGCDLLRGALSLCETSSPGSTSYGGADDDGYGAAHPGTHTWGDWSPHSSGPASGSGHGTAGGGSGSGVPGGGGSASGTPGGGGVTGVPGGSGGSGGVTGVPAGGAGSSPGGSGTAAAFGELPVTGTSSPLLTTVGFALIVGGAGILYLTRLGDRGEEGEAPRVPSPRDRRPAPNRRRRPQPQPTRRG
ncbi:hypothetical protein GCM10007977_090750 [Dactylosporangium sucinum]|uniref:Gram-positive cocci surface proteins LPxTG domain-containing protein n=2 Tax=Dactylosporangium sucinum TaxID=1424081 RepID=A0A917UCV9_9ACTN|nr:hypothetical protein GCM10007977_090750 [Dactylosporangium sucinum]